MDERTLSEWEHDGGSSYRLRRDPYGNKIMAVVVSNAAGWSVEHPGGGESPRGPECGKAGRAAADRAALELGWTLEGGPAAPPVDASALQAEVARLTAELAERTRERDYWSDEVKRLQDAAAERADDRLCGITERERALERAIVSLALRMGER